MSKDFVTETSMVPFFIDFCPFCFWKINLVTLKVKPQSRLYEVYGWKDSKKELQALFNIVSQKLL